MSAAQYLQKLYDDPVFFAEEVWHFQNLNKYGRLGRYEHRMIRWACLGPGRRGVLGPRGLGKTYFGAIILALWRLYREANVKILIVSRSIKSVQKTAHLLKLWIKECPFLVHLYAEHIEGKRWAAFEFDVATCEANRMPSVTVIGIDGQLPSLHVDLVIPDDVETDENVKTAEGRADVWEKCLEFKNIATYGAQEICYFGTFHHDQSTYVRLNNMWTEDKRQVYQFRSWPICYPTAAEAKLMIGLDPAISKDLATGKAKAGDRVFPHRHSPEYIADEKAHGPTYWARQKMLIPAVTDDLLYPLKLRDLIVFDINRDRAPIAIGWGLRDSNQQMTSLDTPHKGFPGDSLHRPIMVDKEWQPYRFTRMWIDLAGKGKDRTAFSIIGALAANLWLKEIVVFPAGAGYGEDVLATIAARAKWHRVNIIQFETNFGLGMLEGILMPYLRRFFVPPNRDLEYPNGWSCSIKTEHSIHQKEATICNALEPILAQHRLIVDSKVAANEDFTFQLTHITRQRGCLEHDDAIECVARNVEQFAESDVRVDPEIAAQRVRNRLEEEEMERDAMLFGRVPPKPRWFSHR